MNVLHITAWYPNSEREQEALFVKRHVAALNDRCRNTVWHVECRHAHSFGTITRGEAQRTTVIKTSLPSFFREWISALLIVWFWLSRDRKEKYDLVNFVVAYPNLVHRSFFRFFIRRPICITDHYSEYHFEFGSTSKGLDRARNLFHHDIPLITVSSSLGKDIQGFARKPDLPFSVVPNVVETEIFYPNNSINRRTNTLFCVAGWKAPKRPDVLFEAVKRLRQDGVDIELIVGGDGPLISEAQEETHSNTGQDGVRFLGRLSPDQVAEQMRTAQLFAHPSDYETFSVVCAEALCCGTPVVASKVGGIPDFVNDSNGALVQANTVEEWMAALKKSLSRTDLDHDVISEEATNKFSAEQIGKVYFEKLEEIVAK